MRIVKKLSILSLAIVFATNCTFADLGNSKVYYQKQTDNLSARSLLEVNDSPSQTSTSPVSLVVPEVVVGVRTVEPASSGANRNLGVIKRMRQYILNIVTSKPVIFILTSLGLICNTQANPYVFGDYLLKIATTEPILSALAITGLFSPTYVSPSQTIGRIIKTIEDKRVIATFIGIGSFYASGVNPASFGYLAGVAMLCVLVLSLKWFLKAERHKGYFVFKSITAFIMSMVVVLSLPIYSSIPVSLVLCCVISLPLFIVPTVSIFVLLVMPLYSMMLKAVKFIVERIDRFIIKPIYNFANALFGKPVQPVLTTLEGQFSNIGVGVVSNSQLPVMAGNAVIPNNRQNNRSGISSRFLLITFIVAILYNPLYRIGNALFGIVSEKIFGGPKWSQILRKNTDVSGSLIDPARRLLAGVLSKLPFIDYKTASEGLKIFYPQMHTSLTGVARNNLGFSGREEISSAEASFKAAQNVGLKPGEDFDSIHWFFTDGRTHVDFISMLNWIAKQKPEKPIVVVAHPFEWYAYLATLRPQFGDDIVAIEKMLIDKAKSANVKLAFETHIAEMDNIVFQSIPKAISDGSEVKISTRGLYNGEYSVLDGRLYFRMNCKMDLINTGLDKAVQLLQGSAVGKTERDELVNSGKNLQHKFSLLSEKLKAEINVFIGLEKGLKSSQWEYRGATLNMIFCLFYDDFIQQVVKMIESRRGFAMSSDEITKLTNQVNILRKNMDDTMSEVKEYLKLIFIDKNLAPNFYHVVFPGISMDLGKFEAGKSNYADTALYAFLERISSMHKDGASNIGMCLDFSHIADDRLYGDEYHALMDSFLSRKIDKKAFQAKIMEWTKPYLDFETFPLDMHFEYHCGEMNPVKGASREAYFETSYYPIEECIQKYLVQIKKTSPDVRDDQQAIEELTKMVNIVLEADVTKGIVSAKSLSKDVFSLIFGVGIGLAIAGAFNIRRSTKTQQYFAQAA